ncbi:hypothetical protein AVEN_239492-1 [Araneus ventricosus]|uniref:Uncharacterized protein n=1 Tax=Araneus ventricosus TaxID=182803 RepID=A0A4Y2UY33_ARAVE|nr:hypothetical protein AVEN_167200-1 [Araneus ventricosus]GBO14536.1 hypothetical protein AVEN_204914-1 [Araneus ventricosus]GBO14621.1 hypothetical protein AVEN_181743-1 [Araneus ventricosus]GBO16419.1 hypothetical protein AVEN_150803-1 [Araneus ventricosus]GBO16520.1 hypothetical protein AVEN_239492-1 [Araneus ventricosus]
MARTSKAGEWPDGVSASVHSSAAKRFAKPRAVGMARLVGIPPTTVHKYEPRATRGLPSHTSWEQGLRHAYPNDRVKLWEGKLVVVLETQLHRSSTV